MTNIARVRALVDELQHALGVSVACGQITLNINQHVFASYDVHIHTRVLEPDAEKHLDRPRRRP